MALTLGGCDKLGIGGNQNGNASPPPADNSGDYNANAPQAAVGAAGQGGATAAPAANSGGKGGGDAAAAPMPAPQPAANGASTGPKGAQTAGRGAAQGGPNPCNDGQDRRVVVINNTGTTVSYLYGSNVDRSTWEEDVLGTSVLAPGQSIRVDWDDHTCMCQFDFKAVTAEGREIIRRNVNVCTESEWRVQ